MKNGTLINVKNRYRKWKDKFVIEEKLISKAYFFCYFCYFFLVINFLFN